MNERLAVWMKDDIPENWIKNLSFENFRLYKSIIHRFKLTLLVLRDKSESYKHSWTMDIPKRIELVKEPTNYMDEEGPCGSVSLAIIEK